MAFLLGIGLPSPLPAPLGPRNVVMALQYFNPKNPVGRLAHCLETTVLCSRAYYKVVAHKVIRKHRAERPIGVGDGPR